MSLELDKQMEEEIQELGLTAPRVLPETIDALMEKVTYKTYVVEGTGMTNAVALLDDFVLTTGSTVCVDLDNFNTEFGAKYAILDAKEKARDKLWELEGYKLKFS